MLRATARIRIEKKTNCMREASKACFVGKEGVTARFFSDIEVG